MFSHLLFQSVSQFVKGGSSPWFLLPAGPHQGVSTRRAVVRSLHAIASLHFLLHLVKSLARGTRVRDSDKEQVELRGMDCGEKKVISRKQFVDAKGKQGLTFKMYVGGLTQ